MEWGGGVGLEVLRRGRWEKLQLPFIAANIGCNGKGRRWRHCPILPVADLAAPLRLLASSLLPPPHPCCSISGLQSALYALITPTLVLAGASYLFMPTDTLGHVFG